MTNAFNHITRDKQKWLIEITDCDENQAYVNAYCDSIACYSMLNFYDDGSIQINPQLDMYVIQLLDVKKKELVDEKLSEFPKAIMFYREVVKKKPNKNVWQKLGESYQKVKNQEEAKKCFRKAEMIKD